MTTYYMPIMHYSQIHKDKIDYGSKDTILYYILTNYGGSNFHNHQP